MKTSIRLGDVALRGLDRFVTAENLTRTALLEAIGRALDDGWRPPRKIIDEAHRIDRERLSRR